MTRAVIYLRQSEDRTGERFAVDRQLAAARRLAEMRGLTVVGEYVENDTSAAGKRERDKFLAVLEHMRKGTTDVLIGERVDRLTRNARDRIALLEAGKEGRTLLACTEGSDMNLGTADGRQMADLLASLAQGEIDKKGERQRNANAARAEAGVARWTRRPFGLDRHDGEVVVVDDEAKALTLAADRVLAGATLASVVRELNAAGSRTSLGMSHTVTGLRRILLNERYAGRSMLNGADLGDGTWPILIDAETQARLADVLRDPTRRLQQGVELKYLLSGAAVCGRCGEKLFASPYEAKGHRYMVLRCAAGKGHLVRRMDPVEELVEGVILGRLAMPDAAALLAPDVDVDALRRDADELRQRRDGIAALLGEGLLSTTAAREQARKLTDALRDVDARISAAFTTSPAAELAQSDDVRATWERLPIRSRRSIVDLLVEVTIMPSGRGKAFDPDDVVIEWKTA